ncbi:hypothetical protein BTJ45_01140 [Bacillus mycoides]|nr:hypothetical protein BTJ45_01140 [Bacillus mycoides]
MGFYLYTIHANNWTINKIVKKDGYIIVDYTVFLILKAEWFGISAHDQTIKEMGIMKFHFTNAQIEQLIWEVNSSDILSTSKYYNKS